MTEMQKKDCDITIEHYNCLRNEAPTPDIEFLVDSSMLDTLRKMVADGEESAAIYMLKKLGRPASLEMPDDFEPLMIALINLLEDA